MDSLRFVFRNTKRQGERFYLRNEMLSGKRVHLESERERVVAKQRELGARVETMKQELGQKEAAVRERGESKKNKNSGERKEIEEHVKELTDALNAVEARRDAVKERVNE
uniref:Uncharacterized protein n=1 Tax=Parascaris univalens TaxID=6257 RepID=A0A915ATG1_PARUN